MHNNWVNISLENKYKRICSRHMRALQSLLCGGINGMVVEKTARGPFWSPHMFCQHCPSPVDKLVYVSVFDNQFF